MINGRVFVARELAPAVIQRLRDEFSEVDMWEPYGPPTSTELAERTAG